MNETVKTIVAEAVATKDVRLCCAITATILRTILAEGHVQLQAPPCGTEVGAGLRRRRAAKRRRRAERERISPTVSTIESDQEIIPNPEGKEDKLLLKSEKEKTVKEEIMLCTDDEILLNTVEEAAGDPGRGTMLGIWWLWLSTNLRCLHRP